MPQRPLCQREGCKTRVNRADAKFCSPTCAQKKSHTPTGEQTLTVEGDSAELTKTTCNDVKSLEDLIAACDIDVSVWHVDRYVCNKWAENYQVKVWLTRKVHQLAVKSELEELVLQAKQEIGHRPPLCVRRQEGRYLLEVSIPDLHAGKLAWSKETGHQNYDTKLAEQAFDEALDALISRTANSYQFSEVLFIVGNDLLNADNVASTTTGGTPQDSDGRFHKTFAKVRQMTIRAIEKLRLIAPVTVLMVSGNHDQLAVWHLGDSLECYFHTYDDVKIDNAPTQRKYHQHGQVMLMFTHGHKGKLNDYPLVMATEQPKMFGETTFREAHTGHKHKTMLDEYHGVRVRISPALCAPDAWHSENQYVGAGRSAEAFVWSPTEGLVGSAFYTVPR